MVRAVRPTGQSKFDRFNIAIRISDATIKFQNIIDVGVNRHAIRRQWRPGDCGVVIGRHDLPLVIDLEGAVAGIADGAVRHQDLEKAAALDGDIEGIVGLDQVALGMLFLGSDHPHTGTERQSGRQQVVLRCQAAGLADGLVDQILELRPVFLETGGVDVGQIIRDHGHPGLLRIQAGFGDPQCWIHDVTSLVVPHPLQGAGQLSRFLRRGDGTTG